MNIIEVRVILVEDDEDDYILVRNLLASIQMAKYELEWVKDFHVACEALQNSGHDICLMDYRLGAHDGLELLEIACKSGWRAPIIFLTGQGDYELDLKAMKVGASDFLLKEQLSAPLLERSIRYAIGRKQVEEELRKSEERFRFLAENTRDVLYSLDYDSMAYSYISPAIESMTGYGPEDIKRIGFSNLVNRIDIFGKEDISPNVLVEDRRNGRVGEFMAEYRIHTRTGESRWLRDHSSPWLDESGRLLGSVGILSDITERKQAEEALKFSEKRLRALSARLLTSLEDERAHLSHDLHDRVGQALVAIKVNVERALECAAKGETDGIADSFLEPLVSMIQKALEDVRKIYMNLRPTVLDDLGIVAAVHYLCREFEDEYPGIRIEKAISTTPDNIPESAKIVIYRILQEALENVARHSESDRVWICLAQDRRDIELVIKDQGVGFDINDVLNAGNRERCLGIASMKERVDLSGGLFAIESAVGDGTIVRASWPCNVL